MTALISTSGSLFPNQPCFQINIAFLTSESITYDPGAPQPSLGKDKYYAVDYVNNYYLSRAIHECSRQKSVHLIQVLAKNSIAHAKRFDWPKHDDVDRVHITCVFLGPVIDLEELEAMFQWRTK